MKRRRVGPLWRLDGAAVGSYVREICLMIPRNFPGEASMTAQSPVIRTAGSEFIGPNGEPLLLRGVCLGGWLNMENFITGYAANETLMRREVRAVIGDD